MSEIATLRNEPSDPTCDALLERLATTEGNRRPLFDQLSQLSKLDPKRVDGALAAWLRRRVGLPAPGAKGIPLYHLVVGRWSSARVAFEGSRGKLSFADLDVQVRRRVNAWLGSGVAPKKLVALGRPFGADLMLDLLAVFRLGACAAWIPPLGQPFEEAALLALNPDFTAGVDDVSAGVVPKAQLLPPPGVGPLSPSLDAPADYAAQAPCLAVVSPIVDDPAGKGLAAPVVLSASELLRALGRDAALIWGLRSGDRLTAPGFDDRRHQPFLTLGAWLVGAGYQHLTLAEVAEPDAFSGEYRAVGVTTEVRDALLSAGNVPRAPRWFRVLEDAGNPAAWTAWVRRVGVDKECLSVALDPGLGGLALTVVAAPDPAGAADSKLTDSAAAKQAVASYHPAYPALGVAWKLAPLPGAVPGDAVGLLKLDEKRAAAPYLLVREDGDGLHWFDVRDPRRRGQVLPRGIVSAATSGLPGIFGTSILALRKVSTGAASFGLIVFVAASVGTWDDVRKRAVTTSLSRHLGRVLHPELRPDFIEVHPILPRWAKAGVDSAWVEGERWSGGLDRRSERELFRQLAAIAIGS